MSLFLHDMSKSFLDLFKAEGDPPAPKVPGVAAPGPSAAPSAGKVPTPSVSIPTGGAPTAPGVPRPSARRGRAPGAPGAAKPESSGSSVQIVDCPLGAECPKGGRHKMDSATYREHSVMAQSKMATAGKPKKEEKPEEGKAPKQPKAGKQPKAAKPEVAPEAQNIGQLGSTEAVTPPPAPIAEPTAADIYAQTSEKATELLPESVQDAKKKKQEAKEQAAQEKQKTKEQAAQKKQEARQQAAQQKQESKEQAAQQKKEEKEKAYKEVREPSTPEDLVLMASHSKRVNKLRENLISHKENNEDLSTEDRELIDNALIALEDHDNIGGVPSKDHQDRLNSISKLSGEFGKQPHVEKKDKVGAKRRSTARSGLGHSLLSGFSAGRSAGAALAAAATSTTGGAGAIGTQALNYGLSGAVAMGHALLGATGGAATTAEEQATKQKKPQEEEKGVTEDAGEPRASVDEEAGIPVPTPAKAKPIAKKPSTSQPIDTSKTVEMPSIGFEQTMEAPAVPTKTVQTASVPSKTVAMPTAETKTQELSAVPSKTVETPSIGFDQTAEMPAVSSTGEKAAVSKEEPTEITSQEQGEELVRQGWKLGPKNKLYPPSAENLRRQAVAEAAAQLAPMQMPVFQKIDDFEAKAARQLAKRQMNKSLIVVSEKQILPLTHYRLAQVALDSGNRKAAANHIYSARENSARLSSLAHRRLATVLKSEGMTEHADFHYGIYKRVQKSLG